MRLSKRKPARRKKAVPGSASAPPRKPAAVKQTARPGSPPKKATALTPLRTSFYNRSMKLMGRIARTASEDRLAEALSAATDVGAVARALSSSELVGPAVAALEPLALLIAKGAEHKEALIAEAGGLLSTAEVARALGVSRQAVYKQRQERKLLAVPHGGEEKFPAIQFLPEGRPLSGLASVLAAIGLEGAWGTLDFLLTPDDDALDGLSPIEVLKRHPERREDVVRLAESQGEHGPG
jgi:hypothetical protein